MHLGERRSRHLTQGSVSLRIYLAGAENSEDGIVSLNVPETNLLEEPDGCYSLDNRESVF